MQSLLQALGQEFLAARFRRAIRPEGEPIEKFLQFPLYLGNLLKGHLQRDQVARITGSLTEPARGPFQVPDCFQRLAQSRKQV